MRRGIFYFFLSSILFAACNEEEDDDPSSCGNSASGFTGNWNITEHCGSNEFGYLLTITSGSSGGITLNNLGDGGPNAAINATLDGNGGFDIPSQTVQGVNISGSGSLNSECTQLAIQWSGWKGSCNATGVK